VTRSAGSSAGSSRSTDAKGTGPILGFLAVRHRLNGFPLAQGEHIGYSVRPSARRRGVAGSALAVGLEEAAGLGIDPVFPCSGARAPHR
jgi:predicted acetyltransferase